MVSMSGGDGGGKEFNTETWYAPSGAGAEKEIDNKRNESTGTVASIAGANESIVRLEMFVPKMMLRVLLVESDDSTRQIIAALLRKCSYRVSAVSDGLKAWEVLKRRAQNFDLILTEVDLPSISGFALLTLITEHKICENIPVIMMSSQDSVNTVYKCMLRGAADFLVKPVRKNELKNLWQHVWRRQASSSSGIGPPEESVGQQTLEATAENNATSKCSRDDMVCIKRSREVVEKGSDEQSSCTKPESEAEGTHLDFVRDLPYSKRSKTSSTKGLLTNIGHINLTKEVEDYHVQDEGSTVATGIVTDHDIQQDIKLDDATKQACGDTNIAVTHSTREAIDLIGAFDKHLTCINRHGNSYDGINKFDSLPFLDLSLKRYLPSGLTNQVTEERSSLNHSDASAFSRYVSKTQCPGHSASPTPCNQLGYHQAISDKPNINAYPCEPSILSPRSMPLNSYQHLKTENQFLVTGLSFQNTPAFYTQETSFQATYKPQTGDSIENAVDVNDLCENMEKQGDHISPETTNQSENTGFCNINRHNPSLENNGELRESGIDEAFRVHVGDSLSSIQREAALTKFRLKRKDRCFEKKVRYENRKKLAEKRPRVKGQFVCQLSNQLPLAKS